MALSVATNNVIYPRLLALVVRKLHDKDPCAINSDFNWVEGEAPMIHSKVTPSLSLSMSE